MRRLSALLILLVLLLGGCAPMPPDAPEADGQLQVHFIDVGQADCALLACDGEYMLIDGGNVADSSLVVSYLQRAGVEALEAVVCSHAHEDHVGGLAGVLAVFPTAAVYAPTRTYASTCFDKFMYYVNQQDLTVQIPTPGEEFLLGGARVRVLGPVKAYPDTNNTSLVLRVTFGETSFLFTGDMEREAETDLLEYGAEVTADVLKVGHHGSSTSTGYRFLYEVDPRYAVISVGTDNSYGHPHEEVVSRLNDAAVTTYRTDVCGTIVATSDGTDIAFRFERETQATPAPTQAEEVYYIGNKNSHKYHLPACDGLPKEENRVLFASVAEAEAAGYTPCARCCGA